MALGEDELFGLVAELDPLGDEQPPAPAADRYTRIFARATGAPVEWPTARRGRRRARLLYAAAAAALFGVGTLVVFLLPKEQSAAAAVRSALERQEEVNTFEATQTVERADGSVETSTVRVSGDDAEIDITTTFPDGRVQRLAVTLLGDLVYISSDSYAVRVDGEVRRDENVVSRRQPGDGSDADIAELSRALIVALEGADVTRAGSEVIAGTVTTRYEIELSDRSVAALSDPVLGFEDLDRMVQFTVWIAGEYPRQLVWKLDDGERATFTFLSIGGEITITTPPGDYTFEADEDPDSSDDPDHGKPDEDD